MGKKQKEEELLRQEEKKPKYPYVPGYNEEFGFTTKTGAWKGVQVNVLADHGSGHGNLTKERLVLALKRLKTAVNGQKLDGYDDTTVGSKNNECTWGLCQETKQMWPDPIDHTFPYDFLNNGRDSHLYQGAGACPMDRRNAINSKGERNKDINGCFYFCRFFRPKPGQKLPTREETMALIDKKLAELESEE